MDTSTHTHTCVHSQLRLTCCGQDWCLAAAFDASANYLLLIIITIAMKVTMIHAMLSWFESRFLRKKRLMLECNCNDNNNSMNGNNAGIDSDNDLC